jgi:hypothetical protein
MTPRVSLDRGYLERVHGGLNLLGRWLLGWVAIAEGVAGVLTLGYAKTGWQLAFVRWCLTKRP